MHFIQHSAGLFLATHQRKNGQKKTRVQFQKLWQEVKRAKTEFTFHLPFVCLIFTKITEFMQKCETETGKKIRQTFRRRGKKEREEKHAIFTNIEIEHPECEN